MTLSFNFFSSILILATIGGLLSCEQKKEKVDNIPTVAESTLFTLLPSHLTNIEFSNELTEGLNTNVLMYEYFYNGGGVATADFNGDGLIDVYFVSSMEKNKFYLNKGNLLFQDITLASGAMGREGPWRTGVAVADVNGDGMLDIYISYSGTVPGKERANQLFINKGNDENNIPLFEDKAEAYGLASMGYSNQIYFFDYDLDGDLDALLLNHNPNSMPVLNEVSTEEFLRKDDQQKGVRLLKQSNSKFEDVTTQSGISGSALTYGLGIGISDINQDGWPDFYVSNDYTVPDYLYINNRNGTFTNTLAKSIGHNSQFSMGNDMGDINNDGLTDIITLDMLPEDNYRQKLLLSPDNYGKFELNIRTGFHYQYMRNMLQLNNGDGTFSELGQLSGISNTDWSWAALLADYDNDGWKDLFVTNGYVRDYTNLDFIKYMNDFVEEKGRLKRTDVLEMINHMPASNVSNYIFSNDNGIHFSNQTKSWGMERPSNSNGASYADLDNDGDLDLVINNINQPAFIYRNDTDKEKNNHFLQIKLIGEGMNTQGIGAKVSISCDGKKQYLEQATSRGYLSAVSPVLHFGLGVMTKVDSVTVTWPRGKHQVLTNIPADTVLTIVETDAASPTKTAAHTSTLFTEVPSPIKYVNPSSGINDFKRQPLLVNPLSFSGPCMVKGDVNKDGLEDVYVGGDSGQSAALFIQQRDGSFKKPTVSAFDEDKMNVDADAVFFDANGDGNLDLYVASGGYHNYQPDDALLQDRLYFGDGKGNFSKEKNALPEMRVSKGCVATDDFNKDGFIDMFVGGRVIPGRYPEAPSSFLLINDGKGKFTDRISEIMPELQKMGMITDAVWLDVNHDGKNELVVVGEWLPISIFSNEGNKLVNVTLTYFDKEYRGWWNKIETADFNSDGKLDLIIGNMGTNTQFHASDAEPAEMYYKDFDTNGSVDPFFCFYIQGKSYPFVTRDELIEQIGSMRSLFPSYKSYANATLQDVFKSDDLSTWNRLKANHMETTLFISTSDNKLQLSDLPIQAQYSPVFTITPLDFNHDGFSDLVLCGNINHAKLRLGKFDANYGVLLKGNGKGGFQFVEQRESGFHLQGDVRSVISIDNTLLFGIGQQPVAAYRLKK